ncbi:thioredoxin-like protein [Imleria badia]|nr:thioredoxin-like protein [Imleria badia]
MMDADIEHLVLSGKLFGTDTRASSPERTPSPTLSFESTDALDNTKHRRDGPDPDPVYESIGMGPGRTGVKGVIRDRHEAQTIQAAKREKEIEALRKRMERGNLGGKTFLEEEEEKRASERWEEGDVEDDLAWRVRRDILGRPKEGPFGHLREVGRAGFVAAVEREERGVWVVVHLYESSLDRCYSLDDTLSKLARLYPQTKFLRARAAALGFASKAPSTKRHRSRQERMPGRFVEDNDDDPYDDGEGEEQIPYYDEDEYEEEDVDTDMLPTLLVYRDGELVHNWVRVDWEAGKAGIEELLSRRHIIAEASASGDGNCGLPSDEEEDLVWSDDEAMS